MDLTGGVDFLVVETIPVSIEEAFLGRKINPWDNRHHQTKLEKKAFFYIFYPSTKTLKEYVYESKNPGSITLESILSLAFQRVQTLEFSRCFRSKSLDLLSTLWGP